MKPFLLLLKKEIKELFLSKTVFMFLLILSFINGYSFYNAVSLYSTASTAALNNPLYATGFEPCPGVFVPAFGGVFILLSLFLPFLIIPLIVLEKERNSLSVLLQIPFTITQILISKLIASTLFLMLIFSFFIPGTVIWIFLGGHIPVAELLLLSCGYFLYGILIITISLFSASIFKNSSGASIFAIFIITLSWIIDFGKDMNISPILTTLADWTTTAQLKYFENGIFATSAILYFIILSLFFIVLTHILLHYEFKTTYLINALIIITLGITAILLININRDITESRRNSFPQNITENIKKLPPLQIDVYLRKTDSRFKDYDDNFLQRINLITDTVTVNMMHGKALDKNYGVFKYQINGRSASTYSNSEEEIFPLIFKLAGIENYNLNDSNHYPGYPLALHSQKEISIIYYTYLLFIPFALCILSSYRILRKKIS